MDRDIALVLRKLVKEKLLHTPAAFVGVVTLEQRANLVALGGRRVVICVLKAEWPVELEVLAVVDGKIAGCEVVV